MSQDDLPGGLERDQQAAVLLREAIREARSRPTDQVQSARALTSVGVWIADQLETLVTDLVDDLWKIGATSAPDRRAVSRA